MLDERGSFDLRDVSEGSEKVGSKNISGDTPEVAPSQDGTISARRRDAASTNGTHERSAEPGVYCNPNSYGYVYEYPHGGAMGGQWEEYSRYGGVKGVGLPPPGVYSDNGAVFLPAAYGYASQPSYNPYALGTFGADDQLYGPQTFQYPSPIYPGAQYLASPSAIAGAASGAGELGPPGVDGSNGGLASGKPLPRPGFPAITRIQPAQPHQVPSVSASPHPVPGALARGYPPLSKVLIGPTGSGKAGRGIGGNGMESRQNGRSGWMGGDKEKQRGRGGEPMSHGDGTPDNMKNRGPRTTRTRNQRTPPGGVVRHTRGQGASSSGNDEALNTLADRDEYNRSDFVTTLKQARFFVIKSYSEDHVHKSIKYSLWASTLTGNKRLQGAFEEAQEKAGGSCPVYLFFSVNASGQFCGVAQMTGPVDFQNSLNFWQQDKWNGQFALKWHFIKDIPNPEFRHIILENNDSKPVTNSRDTQEVKLNEGIEMLNIFKDYTHKTSILDDYDFYDHREKAMEEKRARQQVQQPCEQHQQGGAHAQEPAYTEQASNTLNQEDAQETLAVDANVAGTATEPARGNLRSSTSGVHKNAIPEVSSTEKSELIEPVDEQPATGSTELSNTGDEKISQEEMDRVTKTATATEATDGYKHLSIGSVEDVGR